MTAIAASQSGARHPGNSLSGRGEDHGTNRHRLARGGNRQLNATIHRIAVTRLRCHTETQHYIARKHAQGKNTKEAIRSLKRHLTRRLWHLLQTSGPAPNQTITPTIS